MSIAIDIVFCLLLLLIVIKHTVKGLVRSLLGGVKLILTALATFVLAPMLFEFSDSVSTAVAYLLTFFASYVIVSAAAFIVERFFTLPFFKSADRLLGFTLGIVYAYVVLSVSAAALTLLLEVSAEQLFGQAAEDIVNSTYIYKFFVDSGLFPKG